MKIVILDGYSANPGDLSWQPLEEIGTLTVYDRTKPEDTIQRAKDAEIVLTNKVLIKRPEIEQLPKLKYVGVLATGYNVVDVEAAREHGECCTDGLFTSAHRHQPHRALRHPESRREMDSQS